MNLVNPAYVEVDGLIGYQLHRKQWTGVVDAPEHRRSHSELLERI
jgi:hypothetical protein